VALISLLRRHNLLNAILQHRPELRAIIPRRGHVTVENGVIAPV
jgi:hypothetical protein